MANRSASSRNFDKARSPLSPVVHAVHNLGVTLRSWGEHLNKNFRNQFVSLGPLDEEFLTFLLRLQLVKIPTLCKGSLN